MALVPGPIAPFDEKPGRWLRMAMHVHTSVSDGWLSPPRQRQSHAWAGYDVVSITDHDVLTPFPNGSDDLLLIGGTEISLIAPKSGGPLHVLGIGITEMPVVTPSSTLRETATAIMVAGGLPYIAHPVWSGLRTDEVDGIELCSGVEIFNASCEVEQGRGHNNAHADVWLSFGHKLNLIATDDTHYPGPDSFHAWINLHATEKSRDAVMKALSAGRFYATTGPRITTLTATDNAITIRCTPAKSVALIANPPNGGMVSSGRQGIPYRGARLRTSDSQAFEGITDNDPLTGATFPITPNLQWVRVEITDFANRMAWSNPVWLS